MASPTPSRDGSGDGPLSPLSPSYYGVYLGSPDPDGDIRRHVYSDKVEALKIAKKCKKSRFKIFFSFEEAENFAINGSEPLVMPGISVTAEKASPYSAPISQDLVRFRKCIEKNDLDSVMNTVSNNPRYLVSSGDTPAILQEGCRYNALHVAAKFNSPRICEYILYCISNPEFIRVLYGEDKLKDTVKQRCDILLDLYLNTPDKAANETPLHYASKIGALEVIKVLVSYDKCDKNRRNKSGFTAIEVVCSRKNDISAEDKNEIIRLLSSDYYIAVFRPLDPVRPPLLEGPFLMTSPSKPNLKNCLDSEMRMSGVAGPMKFEEALNFKKLWKRPRGSPLQSPSSPISPIQSPPLAFSPSSFKKPDKIIERIGRELCSELGVYWVEYWPFLGDFANFQKEKGLEKLEQHFSRRFSREIQSQTRGRSNKFSNCSQVSPDINDLCAELGALSIGRKCNTKIENLSYLHIEKTCQVYANKLAESLIRPNFHHFLSALNRCQGLLTSCATDSRYVHIEFNRIHSRLAFLVKKKISEENPNSISQYVEFLEDFRDAEGSSLNHVILCICRKMLCAFHGNYDNTDRNYQIGIKNVNEETVKSLWLSLDSCECASEMKMKTSKKRLEFYRDKDEQIRCINLIKSNLINSCVDKNENNMIINDCDSDSSYGTPPSSPDIYCCSTNDSLISETAEAQSSDEEMYSADEGEPITIEGDRLTEIDRVAYETVDKDKVLPTKHPFIYQWLQACRETFHNFGATSTVVFSPLSPIYLKKCEEIKLSLREHLNSCTSK